MALQVRDETIKRTTKCPYNFGCLERETYPKHPVEYAVKGAGVFIKAKQEDTCDYIMPFGYSYICNCPVRCEIYEKYGK